MHYGKAGHVAKSVKKPKAAVKANRRARRKRKVEDMTDITDMLDFPKPSPLRADKMQSSNIAGSLVKGLKAGQAAKRIRTRRKTKKA